VVFVGPPVAGGIIGYFTNDIAIKCCSAPTGYLLCWATATFTPGLIPRNQERQPSEFLTIMGSLLTPSELQNLARRLLQPERVQKGILWLLRMALTR